MSCLWDSALTLKGLFWAAAQGQDPVQGNAWLKGHADGILMQEAATLARIAADVYRHVDEQSQQVSLPTQTIAWTLDSQQSEQLVISCNVIAILLWRMAGCCAAEG